MACSNPYKLYKDSIKPSKLKNHSDFETLALRRSFNEINYIPVPCGQCLNCRIDKQNQLVDRAEYEYANKGCGAFVTFTYDDIHLNKNQFIDSHTGNVVSTINKKDGKEFLDRLNKLVHKEIDTLKKKGIKNFNLINPNYTYILTSEYGDKFKRPHFHALFFGLDFAFCERLFWRAWQGQGAIQVGGIKNGGIAYCVKYISNQEFGQEKFFKYNYHHLAAPSSSHSLGLGEGLYLSQLKYIKNHHGCYNWRGKDKPLPSYYKNKYKVIDFKTQKEYETNLKNKMKNIKLLYGYDVNTYKDFLKYSNVINNIKQKNAEIKLHQKGEVVRNEEKIAKEIHNLKYNRLPKELDKLPTRIITPYGLELLKVGHKYKDQIKPTDLYKMGSDYNQLCNFYGKESANKLLNIT